MTTTEQGPKGEIPLRELFGGHEISDSCKAISERALFRSWKKIQRRSEATLEGFLQLPSEPPRATFQGGETFKPDSIPPGTVVRLSGLEGVFESQFPHGRIGNSFLYGVVYEDGLIDILSTTRQIEYALAARKLYALSRGFDHTRLSQEEIDSIRAHVCTEIKTPTKTGEEVIHLGSSGNVQTDYFFRIDRVDVMRYGTSDTEKSRQRGNPLGRLIPRRT